MADPQVENGYTRIANEILKAMACCDVRGSEFMIMLAVVTKTYGWNKTKDQISLSEFANITKMDRRECARSVKSLIERNMLGSDKIVTRGSDKSVTMQASTYWIQKDYDKWRTNLGSDKINSSGKIVTRGSDKIGTKVVTNLSLGVVTNAYNTQKTTLKTTKDILSPPPKRIEKPKKDVSPVKVVQDFFYKQHLDIMGEAYVADFGKDGTIFKNIVAVLPPERVKELIVSFFQSQDEFIKQAGYTVGVFKSQINKLKSPTSSMDRLLAQAGLRKD